MSMDENKGAYNGRIQTSITSLKEGLEGIWEMILNIHTSSILFTKRRGDSSLCVRIGPETTEET